jgi:arabinofuranosyltransferase
MPVPDSRRLSANTLVTWAGLLLLAVLIVRTAWMCDDAYITMRSVDNAVHGYGLRWNVAERVQSFTHPAWLALILPFYAVTREPFFTVLTLQILLTLACLWVGARRLGATPSGVVLWFAAFASSKALVDFSTSGLENPLTHLLLVLLLVVLLRDRDRERSLVGLGLLTSALLLCRLDMVVLVGPLIAAVLWPLRRERLTSFLFGFLPFVLWEFFSLIYYGMLVPNTALAKLPPGVSLTALMGHGVKYLIATAYFDPMTPILLAGAVVLLAIAGGRAGRIIALGLLLHVAYVISVGGDFMTGRFLTPALVLGLAGALACVRTPVVPALRLSAAVALIAGSLLGPAPPIATGPGFAVDTAIAPFDKYGVADERRFYYPSFGLWRALMGDAKPSEDSKAVFGRARRAVADKNGGDVISAYVIGALGYYAGPGVYIIDRYGLADPFLARLPPKPGWRVGHYERDLPDGYVDSRRENWDLFTDARLREIFDRVDLLTRAPLWDRARLRAIFLSR